MAQVKKWPLEILSTIAPLGVGVVFALFALPFTRVTGLINAGLDITGATGLTPAQAAALQTLGAINDQASL